MNYGYYNDSINLELKKEDEIERYPAQLYHHLCSKINLNNLTILEVGCGRGGGASFIARYYNPKKIYGIDLSPNAIKLCKESHNENNLEFLIGDSENIPFDDGFFDVVINVESSHCYPSIPKFINEVGRVLKKDGKFLYCDFLINSSINEHLEKLKSDILLFENYTDITNNIIKASELMTEQRKNLMKGVNSNFLRNTLESFAAVKGSKIYNSFVDGHYKYISLIKTKK
tara:strand:- start:217 stop:903 length:687 start_codon:yes stop_codon:yes gene_type:complete